MIGCDRKAWRNRELNEEQSKLVTLFPLGVTKEGLVLGLGKAWEMDTKMWGRPNHAC